MKRNPFGRHAVEMRRANAGMAVATQIAIAEVVGEDDDDVGLVRGGRLGRGQCTQALQQRAEISRKWIANGLKSASGRFMIVPHSYCRNRIAATDGLPFPHGFVGRFVVGEHAACAAGARAARRSWAASGGARR